MKTSIETINGQPYTVVWYDPDYPGFCYNGVVTEERTGIMHSYACDLSVAATALPALPRNPTAEDAPLLYRYAAEGIDVKLFYSADKAPQGYYKGSVLDNCVSEMLSFPAEIYQATDPQGNRVEVAIKESE